MKKHYLFTIALLALSVLPIYAYRIATESGTGPIIELPESLEKNSVTLKNMLEDIPADYQEPIPLPLTQQDIKVLDTLIQSFHSQDFGLISKILVAHKIEVLDDLLEAVQFLDIQLPVVEGLPTIKSLITKAYAHKIIDAYNKMNQSQNFDDFIKQFKMTSIYENNLEITQNIPLIDAISYFVAYNKQQLFLQDDTFNALAFDDSNSLWVGSESGVVYKQDLTTDQLIERNIKSKTSITHLLYKNPYLVTLARSNKLSVWDVPLRQRIVHLDLPARILKDALSILNYSIVFLEEAANNRILYRKINTADETIEFVGFQVLPTHIQTAVINARFIAIFYADGEIQFFNPANGEIIATHQSEQQIVTAKNNGQGNLLALLGATGAIKLIDVADIQAPKEIVLAESQNKIFTTIALSDNESIIAALTSDYRLHVWDAQSGEILYIIDVYKPAQPGIKPVVQLSNDGQKIAVAVGNSVYLYSLLSRDAYPQQSKLLTMEQRLFILKSAAQGLMVLSHDKLAMFQSLPEVFQQLIGQHTTGSKNEKCLIM